jgi:hypothetical protein
LYGLTLAVDDIKGNIVKLTEGSTNKTLIVKRSKMTMNEAWRFETSVQSGQLNIDNYQEICARTDVTSLTPEKSERFSYERTKEDRIPSDRDFSEDFHGNKASTKYDWYLSEGINTYEYNESGYLELTSPQLSAKMYNVMAVPYDFQNGKISVDFSLAEFTTSAFEIFFRALPHQHPAMSESYYLHLFDWKDVGYCGIYKVKNGEHLLLRMVDNLPPMRQGVWHTAELKVQEDEFIFSIDGKERFNFSDEELHEPGNVAFGVKYGRVYIDNIRIEPTRQKTR